MSTLGKMVGDGASGKQFYPRITVLHSKRSAEPRAAFGARGRGRGRVFDPGLQRRGVK